MTTPHEKRLKQLRDWIRHIQITHAIPTPSDVARQAGVSESTLTRLMNPDGRGNLLREGTITKIEAAFNIPRPESTAPPQDTRSPGVSAPTQQQLHDLKQQLASIAPGNGDPEHAFIVKDRALDLAGYLPNDLFLVNGDAPPEIGDIVAIRLKGSSAPSDVTLRIYDTPFLTSHSSDDRLRRPLMIEPSRIEILGVVTTSMRQRANA